MSCSFRRKIPARTAVLLAFMLVCWSGGVRHAAWALDLVAPSAEEKARCDKAPNDNAGNFCTAAYTVPKLVLPVAAQEGSSGNLARMGIFKPPGSGPFPAIILMHTCADLNGNDQMGFWVRAALERGYVAFVLDSFDQRGMHGDDGCGGVPRMARLSVAFRARDAFDAAAHLASLPYVNSRRIAAMGFSQGGRVAYMLSGSGPAAAFKTEAGLAAVIAVYGQCNSPTRGREYVPPNPAIPLLALLGDRDADGDVKNCLPRLERAKASGGIVEWTVFPGVGHVWDQPSRMIGRNMAFNEPPGRVWFEYNEQATLKSRDLAFGFLDRVMK